MPYIGQGLSEGTRQLYTYTATANQSVFSASYTPGKVDVFQNGVLLFPNDYTATDGATITLSANASLNDEISIIAQDVFSVLGNVSNNFVTGAFTSNNYLQSQGYGTGDVSNNYSTSAYVSNTSFEALKSNSLGRRNLIINGAMEVWQRGTSQTTSGDYAADRFWMANASSAARDSDAPSGFTYSTKLTYNGSVMSLGQPIELPATGKQGQLVAGSVVTLSYYAKVDTGTESITTGINFRDSKFSATNEAAFTSSNFTATWTETWTRYTHSFTIPSINSTNVVAGLEIGNIDRTAYITGVQLELGDTATPFEYRSYGEELALCQRYFEVNNGVLSPYIGYKGFGASFAVTKRNTPTITFYSGVSLSGTTGSVTESNVSAALYSISSFDVNVSCIRRIATSYSSTTNMGFSFTADAEL